MKKISLFLSLILLITSMSYSIAAGEVLSSDVAYSTADFQATAADENSPAAFPGAEGGGMYTTGARAAASPEIYHVTTLADYNKDLDEPVIKGSLRDAVSSGNRIIVFDVAGNIELKARLNISGGNLTILGQTAPGDGICVTRL